MYGEIRPLEARCERANFSYNQCIDLWFAIETVGTGFAVAKPLILEAIGKGESSPPTVTMPIECAQQLIDELWRCGLRPSEGTGSAGSLAATERHLADMQKIAYSFLKIDK